MAAVRAVRDLVERMLCAGGPLPALCEEQRTLARIVAEALDAPPGDEALVTLTQAATGTGKTVALLAPILAIAALQKRQGVRSHRATLSTYTNQLTRQILEDDAPRVSRALESLGYPAVSVATRAGRRQFIDPDRVERALARLGDRRDGPDGRCARVPRRLFDLRGGRGPWRVPAPGLHRGRALSDAEKQPAGRGRVCGVQACGGRGGRGAHQSRPGAHRLSSPRPFARSRGGDRRLR